MTQIPNSANMAQGDLLVSCLALNAGSFPLTSAPAGWTRLTAVTTLANPRVNGYYKVPLRPRRQAIPGPHRRRRAEAVSRGIPAPRGWTPPPRPRPARQLSSGTVPAVTSTTANAMLVGCMSDNSGSVTLASPAGMTQAVAGPSGAKTWTFSAARERAGWLVALRTKTP